MKTVNKLLALLLTLALLVSVPVAAFAEESSSALFSGEIKHSITVEENTGKGLAYLFEVNVSGAAINEKNEFVNDNATAIVDGVEYHVVAMGAVMANQPEDIANINNLTRDDVNEEQTILDVPVRYLFAAQENTCSFAVRIIRLPEEVRGFAIAARPYVVLEDAEGNESTCYGNGDISTYNACYYENMPEEKPVLSAETPELDDDRLKIADATAEYVAYDPATYREAFKVSLTLNNVSTNAKTSEGDTIACTFKDAEGNVLGAAVLTVDELAKGETKDVEIYLPVNTAIIEATCNLNYVPDIIMPAIGSDIDVTKKKNRIRVSATEASFNEDGTIHVKWTFKNYTSNWITEETDYIKYAYYNAAGTKLKTVTLYIGVIDTKKNPVKTFEFDVPSDTTKVSITSSKIVYWTEWA